MTLMVRVLGPLAVELDGRPIALGGLRQRSLLALLVLHRNRFLTADAIADSLWPDEQPLTAIKTIQVYVSRMRRLFELDGARLHSTGGGYRFDLADDELDSAQFEAAVTKARASLDADLLIEARTLLENGLTQWRGAALGDVADQPFARFEADRLEELRWVAREDLFESRLLAGDARAVLGDIRQAVGEQPHRERLVGLLMRALYAEGRQTEALAAYHQARHELSEELGVDPGPALRDLEAAILRQELTVSASLDVGRSVAGPVQSPRAPLPKAPIGPSTRRAMRVPALLLPAGVLVIAVVAILANAPRPSVASPSASVIANASPTAPASNVASSRPLSPPASAGLVVVADPSADPWAPTVLGPGVWTWQRFRPTTSFTIAADGWEAGADNPDGAQIGYGTNPPAGEIFFIRAQLVLDKPCFIGATTRVLGDRPLDFVNWLTAHPWLSAGTVNAINVAGYPGLTVDVSIRRSKTAADCPADGGQTSLARRIPLFAAAGHAFVLFNGDRGRFTSMDIGDGPPVLIMVRAQASHWAEFIKVAEPVIDSLVVQP